MKAKRISEHQIEHQIMGIDKELNDINEKIKLMPKFGIRGGGGGGGGGKVIVSTSEPRKEKGIAWLDINA